MKRLVEQVDGAGLETLLGERVLLLCGNYFYEGKLVGVNDDCVELHDPGIVYEAGPWAEPKYATRQSLPSALWFVRTAFIESYGRGKDAAH